MYNVSCGMGWFYTEHEAHALSLFHAVVSSNTISWTDLRMTHLFKRKVQLNLRCKDQHICTHWLTEIYSWSLSNLRCHIYRIYQKIKITEALAPPLLLPILLRTSFNYIGTSILVYVELCVQVQNAHDALHVTCVIYDVRFYVYL